MNFDAIKAYLAESGYGDRVMQFEVSSATVELAAQAVGCEAARIAKTISFLTHEGALLIVAAGDVKVDNGKFKARFAQKAKMIPFDMVEELTGFKLGGVCPFCAKDGVAVYLDESENGRTGYGTIGIYHYQEENTRSCYGSESDLSVTSGWWYMVRGVHTVIEGSTTETTSTQTSGMKVS